MVAITTIPLIVIVMNEGAFMRYSPEHVDATRTRVFEACERQFRESGFAGVGVEALSRTAGVTTGAFYNHFGSKAAAFATVVAAGMERVCQVVAHFRASCGAKWLERAANYYLGAEHRGDVGGGCALPSLSADVSRADPATRQTYETDLAKAATMIAEGLPDAPDRRAGWPVLAQLVGAVVLARAVLNKDLAQEIADSVLASIVASQHRAGRATRSQRPTSTSRKAVRK
jgi:AcrR family transcriptional regulator